MNKVHKIAILAEDDSDCEVIKNIITRLTNKNNLFIRKKSGNGCATLRRKCLAWSNEFAAQGFDMMILVHDKDSNKLHLLKSKLSTLLSSSTFENRYICIPVEEIEAWFLTDPLGVKETFGLHRLPKFSGRPEEVSSPKEYLAREINKCSNRSFPYVNTIHNKHLSEVVNLDLAEKKSESFRLFKEYILSHQYS